MYSFLLRHKWIINSLAAYFTIWLLLVSADSIAGFIHKEWFDGLDHSYWHTYVSIEPVKNTYAEGELINFESIVIAKRPTAIAWNDIIYCDLEGDSTYEFFTNYESSVKQSNVKEITDLNQNNPTTTTHQWWYGDARTKKPPTGAECYLVSEITYCPQEIAKTKEPCRRQTVRSQDTFRIK